MWVLLQAAWYDNYNSVTTSLVTEKLNFSLYSTPSSKWVLPIHRSLSWTRSFRTLHCVIMLQICFQGLLNATFWYSNFRTMTWSHCIWQTQLPRIAAALTSPESCTKASCVVVLEHQQKLAHTTYSEWRVFEYT
jgi:hypothetical protein